MAKNKKLKLLRDDKIRKRFQELCNIEEDKVSKYSYEWIMKQLTKEFYLAELTLLRIINHK